LRIQPSWARPLHAPESPLVVKSLKVKDSAKPGKDKVKFTASVNAGGQPLDASSGGLLRLVDASNGALFMEVDLAATGPSAKRATPDGAVVKAKLALNLKGSSRGSISVKVSGLDLPGPLPTSLRVELALGDALLSQELTTAGGKAVGSPRSHLFSLSKLKSKVGASGSRTTTVAGTFSPIAGVALSGVVEIVVGTARVRVDVDELTVKGNKRIYKGRELKKLVVDLAKGTFSAKLASDHDLLVSGRTPVSLRLGGSFYGDTNVLPFDKGSKTQY